jgi:outer membrane protein OmpA-like peptidoglycan-associated protein
MNAVYFEPNSVLMIESDLAVLDNAGRRLQDKAALKVTLVAYYAPEKTAEWQVQRDSGEPALSAARAEMCAEYLTETYGIAPERIKIEYRLASEKKPELYRCVELVVK